MRAGNPQVTEATLREVDRMVRDSCARLTELLPGTPSRPFEVFVHPDLDSVPEEVGRFLHRGTAGVALLLRDQIHLILEESLRRPPHDLATVVEHEVVHILLEHFAGDAARWVPRWVHEGIAQELSEAAYLDYSEDELYLRARAEKLLRFSELRRSFPDDPRLLRLAYAQSFSYVSFLRRQLGMETLLEVVRASGEEDWFRSGLLAVTGVASIEYEERWRKYVLEESGAGPRWWGNNCFSILMIAGTVLLVLAGFRVFRRERIVSDRLARQDVAVADPDDR